MKVLLNCLIVLFISSIYSQLNNEYNKNPKQNTSSKTTKFKNNSSKNYIDNKPNNTKINIDSIPDGDTDAFINQTREAARASSYNKTGPMSSQAGSSIRSVVDRTNENTNKENRNQNYIWLFSGLFVGFLVYVIVTGRYKA